MPSLSIVVIGRNEEQYITVCLQAVLAAVAEAGDAEVVYVDSASTDRTVALVQALGVRVLELRPDWRLSPSAGRYIGFHHTMGELVMFVDSDTLLERTWLRRALPHFVQPDVAGVSGFLDDLDPEGRPLPYVGQRKEAVCAINELRGSGLYRRAALEQVGPFNPWLVVEEESELGLRLRHAGWRLLHLPEPMGCHQRGAPRLAELLRAWRLGRFRGLGLTWRYLCEAGLGWRFCRERLRPALLFTLLSLLLSPGLFCWYVGYARAAVGFLAGLVLWLGAVAFRKRSLLGPVEYVLAHLMTLFGLFTGLRQWGEPLADPQSYPREASELSPAEDFTLPEAAVLEQLQETLVN